jgi:hypothetical protein
MFWFMATVFESLETEVIRAEFVLGIPCKRLEQPGKPDVPPRILPSGGTGEGITRETHCSQTIVSAKYGNVQLVANGTSNYRRVPGEVRSGSTCTPVC